MKFADTGYQNVFRASFCQNLAVCLRMDVKVSAVRTGCRLTATMDSACMKPTRILAAVDDDMDVADCVCEQTTQAKIVSSEAEKLIYGL
jgi:hypothetical protein